MQHAIPNTAIMINGCISINNAALDPHTLKHVFKTFRYSFQQKQRNPTPIRAYLGLTHVTHLIEIVPFSVAHEKRAV